MRILSSMLVLMTPAKLLWIFEEFTKYFANVTNTQMFVFENSLTGSISLQHLYGNNASKHLLRSRFEKN